MENLKQAAAVEAAKFVKDSMVLGLGTGSTAAYFVDEVARLMTEEGLSITAVTTSFETASQAEKLGIPLKSIDEVDHVDLTVDGADEVDAELNGIKGGGGALLMEKVVACYSRDYIWIVDDSKPCKQLGAFKLPVEVVTYGAEQLFRIFEERGYKPSWRMRGDERLLTDMKNLIIDLDLGVIKEPEKLADELKSMCGVVEHGLFINMVKKVIVASSEGIKILEK
ncbi:ribose-5-phosphate isomerase RpiA [Lactococcus termiticola]|uniref:Ribose-5-phosphate isomerase A n=1 Tax=Lactococcus termiticola TaxID=2169526 RepID=A0A2R5HGB5_9LACT|nr:ribose-5-phosphate isomerase RpiA [Lactococcus termiticola]GBG96896.1 ribose-5-phosphate isomerase A [Lactococcus termiticola]